MRLFLGLLWCVLSLYGVELSVSERAYLEKLGPINVCVDPDWAPFEHLSPSGEYEGIGADLLGLVAQRLAIPIRIVPTKDWDESIAASKQGRCHILSFLNQTPARNEWLLFTEPHFSDVNVFITREEHPFIADPAALSEQSIVFPSGTAMEEMVRKAYPNLSIINTATEMEAFQMVSDKQVDMTMRSLIVAAYTIKKEGLFNLKISGQLPNYTNHFRIGVIRKEPMLRDILNKGIATLSNKDKERIINQHVMIKAQTGIDYGLIYKLTLLFSAILLAFIYRQTILSRYNKQLLHLAQTDILTGLYNRTKIDQRLSEEIARALRLQTPFAVLIMDLDHFKRINDTYGHPMGDRALISFAKVAKEALRSYDTIGRWGGEEFLVLCPGCLLDEALSVAERIRLGALEMRLPHDVHVSVSIGVAVLHEEDTPHTLIARADSALYQAKEEGRNRVCSKL